SSLARWASDRVATNALRASSAARRRVSFDSGSISGRWPPGPGGSDGTTVAVCRKSSDATNVRWEPCAPDQGPDRDSSLGYLIASGIFVASYRAVPVDPYLGDGRVILKLLGERLEAPGERFGALHQRRVRAGRLGGRRRHDVRAAFHQLVGQEQRGEQELARFAKRAEPGQRFAALAVDEPRRGPQGLLLALAAGDLVGAPGDIEVDHRRHQAAASRISSSSSSTT